MKDDSGAPIANASVVVMGRDHPILTTVNGEYWRLLTEGEYDIAVYAEGFVQGCVTGARVPSSGKLNLDFSLSRVSADCSETSPFECISLSSAYV